MPVLLAVLGSCALYAAGAYRFPEAGALDGSSWLTDGGGMQRPGQPDIWDAVAQGSFRTFLHGDFSYDSSLWTMRFEFLGSFIAFGLALLLLRMKRVGARVHFIALTAVACFFANPSHPFYVAFPAGVALAAFLPQRRSNGWPGLLALAVAGSGVFLLGYSGVSEGAFRFMAAGWLATLRPEEVNILGAISLIAATEQSAELHGVLSQRLGVLLGRLSFPLYLVHVPVICSAGAAAYMEMRPDPLACAPRVAACAIGGVVAISAAFPLMWANEWWVGRLNRWIMLADQPNARRAFLFFHAKAERLSATAGEP